MFTYKRSFWILFIVAIALSIYQYGLRLSLEGDNSFKTFGIYYLEYDTDALGEMASKRLYRTHNIDTLLTNNYYISYGVITHSDIIS